LLPAEQAVEFRGLSMGEKEVRMERAWRETDPSPETGENEVRLEFLKRVEIANARYTIFGPGMLSDRGRVYIRYGEPDETKVERLPVADKTLGYALGDQIPKSSRDALTKTETGAPDFRPYEIWTYNLRGREIGKHYGMSEINSGMKFVFVDDHGYGEYTLRYSSTSGMH
ncbi:MAG TPA: GWxTD domain-containing protein, partial [Candidatus Eisenbacteria bacterium]|nr:GWxTD domain-containing protein [Candidatus Eisenbacteria bacterium]